MYGDENFHVGSTPKKFCVRFSPIKSVIVSCERDPQNTRPLVMSYTYSRVTHKGRLEEKICEKKRNSTGTHSHRPSSSPPSPLF